MRYFLISPLLSVISTASVADGQSPPRVSKEIICRPLGMYKVTDSDGLSCPAILLSTKILAEQAAPTTPLSRRTVTSAVSLEAVLYSMGDTVLALVAGLVEQAVRTLIETIAIINLFITYSNSQNIMISTFVVTVQIAIRLDVVL